MVGRAALRLADLGVASLLAKNARLEVKIRARSCCG